MHDSLSFAVDVFRTVCDRFRSKAKELQILVETGSSFEEWLNWEAYLACKSHQESYPFCEVTAKPTYASEGVPTDVGDPDRDLGDLRVGGPNDGAHHCWLFAEIVFLNGGTGGTWLKRIEADAAKLKRLGWKRSAALLIIVTASRTDGTTECADYLAGCTGWNRSALTETCVIPLSDRGSVVVKAFDIKPNPADTLSDNPLSTS